MIEVLDKNFWICAGGMLKSLETICSVRHQKAKIEDLRRIWSPSRTVLSLLVSPLAQYNLFYPVDSEFSKKEILIGCVPFKNQAVNTRTLLKQHRVVLDAASCSEVQKWGCLTRAILLKKCWDSIVLTETQAQLKISFMVFKRHKRALSRDIRF